MANGVMIVESRPEFARRLAAFHEWYDKIHVACDFLGMTKQRQAMPDLPLLLSVVHGVSSHRRPRPVNNFRQFFTPSNRTHCHPATGPASAKCHFGPEPQCQP
jgi:hypothetical protein